MHRRAAPLTILIAYLVAALTYVALVPPWQSPDEPAHFNYARHYLQTGTLPVLHMGDYPVAELQALLDAGFPPGNDVSAIRYEYHQPPLYYVMAAPVLGLAPPDQPELQLRLMRLYSVLWGLATLLVTYGLGRHLWPRRHGLAAALMAFSAFVPMHTAISAAANNDLAAECVTAAGVLLLLRQGRGPRRGGWTALGALVGLGALIKTTAMILVPLAGLGLLLRRRRQGEPGFVTAAGQAVLPALALALPWFGRNLAVYGWPDFLGLQRHAEVVHGQLTTAQRLAEVGAGELARGAAWDAFRSFWGVFGWMAVPMHQEVYWLLGIAVGIAALAWAWRLGGRPAEERLSPAARKIIVAWAAFSILGMLWYNLSYYQPQGRYLFVAMPAWGAVMVLGWTRVLRQPLWPGAALLAAAGSATMWEATQGDIPGRLVLILVAAAVALVAWGWLARRVCWAAGAPLALLWLLNLAGAAYYVRVYLDAAGGMR